jgi:biotin carboxyl carrier protein
LFKNPSPFGAAPGVCFRLGLVRLAELRLKGEEVNEAKRAEIKIPKIAGASNLTIGRWFKRVGDPVSIGEPVVEIDTYNLTHELQAPATGILSSVIVKDGGSVEPGTVIGTIDQV